MTLTDKQLTAKFNKLNKKYVTLSNKQGDYINEDDMYYLIAQQMEDVQVEMGKISALFG